MYIIGEGEDIDIKDIRDIKRYKRMEALGFSVRSFISIFTLLGERDV